MFLSHSASAVQKYVPFAPQYETSKSKVEKQQVPLASADKMPRPSSQDPMTTKLPYFQNRGIKRISSEPLTHLQPHYPRVDDDEWSADDNIVNFGDDSIAYSGKRPHIEHSLPSFGSGEGGATAHHNVTFNVENQQYHANLTFLSIFSNKFHDLLDISKINGSRTVNLLGISSKSFELILNNLHSGKKISINKNNIHEISLFAHRFELESIKSLCTSMVPFSPAMANYLLGNPPKVAAN